MSERRVILFCILISAGRAKIVDISRSCTGRLCANRIDSMAKRINTYILLIAADGALMHLYAKVFTGSILDSLHIFIIVICIQRSIASCAEAAMNIAVRSIRGGIIMTERIKLLIGGIITLRAGLVSAPSLLCTVRCLCLVIHESMYVLGNGIIGIRGTLILYEITSRES